MNKEKTRTVFIAVLFLVFAAAFVVGMQRGELTTVFNKASNICLQCIGIG